MLTVGQKFPEFKLTAVKAGAPSADFAEISSEELRGKWNVVFWWPMDFTFVCPTEIAEFGRRMADFKKLDTQVYGASTDTHFVHLAWKEADKSLRELPFPMLADHKRELAEALGIIHPEGGVASRATFIIDPEGVIRHVTVNDLDVGRSIPETLRVLEALQTGELTPCNWEPGQDVLKPGA